VLVVDGDPDSGNFLASRLAKCGIDALYAADAWQACRIAAKEMPSIIIADSVMPDGDAEFLLRRLRAAPATAAIPVCVVSARRLSELEEHNLRREIAGWPGAAEILRKSFDTEELFATLRQYCGFRTPAPPRSCLQTVGW
jgi:DNA-binding response OmpR family regulator